MATTNFVAGTVVASTWLNDVDADVYEGLVNVKHYGAIGNGVADDTTAMQAAFNAAGVIPNRGVYFPSGTYLISAKMVIGAAAGSIMGQAPGAVLIKGSHSGILFELQEGVANYRIENLNFGGTNCTGIAAKDSGGALRGYLIASAIRNCKFYWELAYGINADCIFLRLSDCDFGGSGTTTQPSPGTNNMVGLYSHSISTNFTNHNSVINCVFNCGSQSTYAVDISGGVVWNFLSCDFEQGGGAMKLDNVGNCRVDSCWFESMVRSAGNQGIISLNPSGAAASMGYEFVNCNFTNNTANSMIMYQASTLVSIVVANCTFGLNTGYPILEQSVLTHTLPGNGAITWRNNYVTGATAGNPMSSTTNFGDTNCIKAWAIYNSATSAITARSDMLMTLTKNSTGNVTLTFSNPLGTSASNVCVVANGQATYAIVASASTTTLNVQTFSRAANVATDDTVHVMVMGK